MLRIDGDIQSVDARPLAHPDIHALFSEIMNDVQWQAYQTKFECDFALEIPGVSRFRVNAFVHHRGAGGVFRTIPSRVPSLEELGMGAVFEQIAGASQGLVAITGPTGSGKSTTLAAMIDHINKTRCRHILTLEDPIEFVHDSQQCLINQREVYRDTLGFSEALKSALREDPDIILVGELRDLTTIRLALEAAETGHLVFATLHTSSAARTVARVVDVFPAAEQSMVRSMLSESLHAVVSQLLIKTGDSGRVAAHEIMLGTPAIRNLIREDKVAQMYSAIQTGGMVGMQTLDQCLLKLVADKVISREMARENARMPNDFR